MLILKEYNLALTSSRLAILTHLGVGFVKTLCLCTMISFLVGLPPLIEKSPHVALLNRADSDMLQFMQYNINQCDASKGETYRLAKEFGQKLIDNTKEVFGNLRCTKMVGALAFCLFMFIINACFCFWSYFPNCATHRSYREGQICRTRSHAGMAGDLQTTSS